MHDNFLKLYMDKEKVAMNNIAAYSFKSENFYKNKWNGTGQDFWP